MSCTEPSRPVRLMWDLEQSIEEAKKSSYRVFVGGRVGGISPVTCNLANDVVTCTGETLISVRSGELLTMTQVMGELESRPSEPYRIP